MRIGATINDVVNFDHLKVDQKTKLLLLIYEIISTETATTSNSIYQWKLQKIAVMGASISGAP